MGTIDSAEVRIGNVRDYITLGVAEGEQISVLLGSTKL